MHHIDKKLIRDFHRSSQHQFKITLMTDESIFSRKISDFAHELNRLAACIKIKKEPIGVDEYPGLYVGDGVRCHFIPSGPKLKTFLDALSFLHSAGKPDLKKEFAIFSKLDLPADLKLYVAEGCPNCPKVVSQLILLPFVNSKIRLSVFDSAYFFKIAEQNAVRTVPTTILDQNFRWTGAIDLSELAQVIRTRDPINLSAASLEMVLKEGNAMGLVEMFQSSSHIYPAFIDLITHPAWSTRLGAMVVMETLIESAPDLAASIQAPIWERFEKVPDTIKGDLLYIIGELNLEEDKMKIMTIANSEYSQEVKEAANEALSKMNDE
jgi:hypothetical protein